MKFDNIINRFLGEDLSDRQKRAQALRRANFLPQHASVGLATDGTILTDAWHSENDIENAWLLYGEVVTFEEGVEKMRRYAEYRALRHVWQELHRKLIKLYVDYGDTSTWKLWYTDTYPGAPDDAKYTFNLGVSLS